MRIAWLKKGTMPFAPSQQRCGKIKHWTPMDRKVMLGVTANGNPTGRID